MKHYGKIGLAVGCLWLGYLLPAHGQDNIGRILQERDALYKQYDHYLSQNSAFFGGKSKKDLTNIINTLKGIIEKDNELIREVRRASQQLKAKTNQQETNYVGQSRETTNRLYDLERQVTSLRSQVNLKNTELQTSRDELANLAAATTRLRVSIVVLTGLLAVLLGYVVQLSRRARKRKTS